VDLRGRAAFVTGGSGSIGGTIARALAGAGCNIAIGYVGNRDGADETLDAVEKLGRTACRVQLDQTEPAAIEPAVERAARDLGRLDILVNNAGISPYYKPAETMTEAEWDDIMRVNLKGVFLCCQAAGRLMIPQKSGRIINISSIAGQVALPRLLAYCSAKGAINQLTRVLAVEWAPHRILVNAIAPGFIETDLTKGLHENPKRLDGLIRQVPLGHLGKPEEIVGAAIYLASDAASYVTGQMLYVDGGWMAL